MLIRSAPGSQPALPQLYRRVRWLVVFVCAVFLILVGRLWQLQVMRGERYHEGVIQNVVSTRYLPSVRGKIVDRNGTPLADNRPAFNIYVTPDVFVAPTFARLSSLLDLDEGEQERVRARVEAGRDRDPRQVVMVLEDQTRDRAALVSQARLELPGVRVVDEAYRRYAHGTTAAHIVGYMNHLTAAELAEYEPQGYDSSELIGRYGLERQWEHYLRGKKGIERYVVDATGIRIDDKESEALIEGPKFEPPVPGHNIVTTLDLELQKIAERAVRWHSAAAIVVIEVDTGRLLAVVSTPSFDPNVMTGHLTRADEQALLGDPRRPFVDKTLRQHYPPGSTFKLVTLIAALEDEQVDPDELRQCRGWHERGRRVFRCPGGRAHGKIDFVRAIKRSCNVYVWELSELVGLNRIAEVARDLGFGAATGVGLNGDIPGRMPTREWYDGRDGFKIGYTLNAATGQGDVEVTVMQLAQAYAALANGGKLYVPQIVRRIENASGGVVAKYEPKLRRRLDVSKRTLELVHAGVRAAVNEEGGTAFSARSEIVAFAGKTGTAQVRGRRRRKKGEKPVVKKGWDPLRDHAWFAGWAPADNPEIAVVVLIEHGGSGGRVAAPVAREIIEGYMQLEGGRP